MSLHSSHSVKIHPLAFGASPAVIVGGITSLSHSLNAQTESPQDGGPYNPTVVMASEAPELSFQTTSLKAILDLVGLQGMCIDHDGTHPGVVAYSQKHERCGIDGRASGANHQSVTYPFGHLFIEQIQASANAHATVSCKVHALSKTSGVKPYAVSYAAELPASPVLQVYQIARPKVLGVQVERVESVTIQYGNNIEKTDDLDSIWPTDLDTGKTQCMITITTRDPEWFESAGRIPGGGVQTDADTELWFLQAELDGTPASGGKFKDFTGLDHIHCQVEGLVYVTQHDDKSGAGVGTTTINIAGIARGGVAPLVWDTSSDYAP